MTTLFACTNTFVADQSAAARQIVSQHGGRFDDLLNTILSSARQQGFAAIELIESSGQFHLRWIGADAFSIHGSWFLMKNIARRDVALRVAKGWYEFRPDLHIVYDGTDDPDESYGILCSLAVQAGRRIQSVA